ncbi:hypothetical protein V4S32_00360 [Enterococcus cecorum]
MTNYKKYLWLYPMLVLLVGLIGGTKTVEVNPDSTTYHVLAAHGQSSNRNPFDYGSRHIWHPKSF